MPPLCSFSTVLFCPRHIICHFPRFELGSNTRALFESTILRNNFYVTMALFLQPLRRPLFYFKYNLHVNVSLQPRFESMRSNYCLLDQIIVVNMVESQQFQQRTNSEKRSIITCYRPDHGALHVAAFQNVLIFSIIRNWVLFGNHCYASQIQIAQTFRHEMLWQDCLFVVNLRA